MKKNNEQLVMAATLNVLVVNLVLSALKLLVGLFAKSSALVADAVHSFADVLGTIIVLVGVKLGGRQPDRNHPYGYERMESAASLILAAIVFATGLLIGYHSIQQVIEGTVGEIEIPGTLALVAAVFTMVVKEGMYWFTRAQAKKTDSSSLTALAWEQRTDVLSSVGAFIGIFGARAGLPILDPIAGLVISLFIIRVAINIFRDAMHKMTDSSCDEDVENEIRSVVLAVTDVMRVDKLQTRLFGDRVYVDIEIGIDGDSSLFEAHHTAVTVENTVESAFEKVKHCSVLINPVEDPRR